MLITAVVIRAPARSGPTTHGFFRGRWAPDLIRVTGLAQLHCRCICCEERPGQETVDFVHCHGQWTGIIWASTGKGKHWARPFSRSQQACRLPHVLRPPAAVVDGGPALLRLDPTSGCTAACGLAREPLGNLSDIIYTNLAQPRAARPRGSLHCEMLGRGL